MSTTESSIPVIDIHGHVGLWDQFSMNDNPARVLAAMDAVGIDISVVYNIFHAETEYGHNATAAYIAHNPQRLMGFAYVTPIEPLEKTLAELSRAIDQLGFAGIKLYPPYMPWPLHDEHWFPIYEFANQRKLPVIFHTGPEPHSKPQLLEHIAPRFPHAQFIAGHSGNFQPYRNDAIAAAQKYSNIYLETCSSFRSPGAIEELVAGVGSERVLFGSDMPLMDSRSQIGKIITARISDDAKRNILGANAHRLLFGNPAL
jgi:predicted TIM-barrel fold metal-dependent hydrolase